MMRLGGFRYYAARNAADAVSALAGGGESAMLLAGGTDLLPNAKRRQISPDLLVGLRKADELRGIHTGRELTIGSMTTLSDLVRDRSVRESQNALFRAAAQVATPLIRNAASLGGNLALDTRCNYYNQTHEWRQAIGFCKKAPDPAHANDLDCHLCWVATSSPRCWAVSSSDTAPALIALGARVTILAPGGEREIPLEDLYDDDGIRHLTIAPGEILTSVRIPTASGRRSTYWKLRRRGSFDFPVLGVAASLQLARDLTVENARVVLGGVASRPLLIDETELLIGRRLTDDVIEEFADAAARHAKPLDNTDFQMTWRKDVARSFLAGVLRELRGDDRTQFPLLAREVSRPLVPTW